MRRRVKYLAYLANDLNGSSITTGVIDANVSGAAINVMESAVVVKHTPYSMSVFPMHNLHAFFTEEQD